MTNSAAIIRSARIHILLAGSLALAVWIFAVPTTLAQSDPVQLWLKVEPETIYIGDPFTITLSATYPSGYFIVFPRVPAEWGEFEVSGQTSAPVSDNGNGSLTSSIQIRATLFSTGEIPTPELSVAIRRPNGEIINRPVRPIDVRVDRIAANDEDLIDIKPQAELDVPFDPLSALDSQSGRRTILAGLVVIGALAVAAWFIWRKLLLPPQPLPSAPAEIAMRELDRIESMPLESESDFKERYTLVSDCLRIYLMGQFEVPAPELTSRETLGAMRLSDIRLVNSTFLSSTSTETSGIMKSADTWSPEFDRLSNILEECDLVKFARFTPEEGDAIKIVERARVFVRETGIIPDAERDSATVGAQTA